MINVLTVEQFQELLPDVCDSRTSVSPHTWVSENPLLGHGAVVALVAQDFFGGQLLRVSLEGTSFANMRSHYFNRLSDGNIIDFTVSQFEGQYPEGLNAEERDRDHLLFHRDTENRYELFASRFDTAILRHQTQRELLRNMRSSRKDAEEASEDVKQFLKDLANGWQKCRESVDTYTNQRAALFLKKLAQRRLDWCTKCNQVFPVNNVQLLLTEGSQEYSHGYGGAYYGFEGFTHLYRACLECREKDFDRHGSVGSYDSLAKGQASFRAFRVEKRADGYYARKFGNWKKCCEISYEFPQVPENLIDQFTEQWSLPPKIELRSRGLYGEDEFIIHEQTPEEVEAVTTT